MKNVKVTSLVITMLICYVSIAQKRTITGTISDNDGPLPGVNVVVEKTKKSTFTDFDGKYSIKANKKDILIFSYTGLKTQIVKTAKTDIINLTMTDSLETINIVPFLCYPQKRHLHLTN